jgi:hypothetical protein
MLCVARRVCLQGGEVGGCYVDRRPRQGLRMRRHPEESSGEFVAAACPD